MKNYTKTGVKPYTRKNGTETVLDVWSCPCAICGELFEVCVPRGDISSKAFGRKHCDEHKLNPTEIKTRWLKSLREAREIRAILGG